MNADELRTLRILEEVGNVPLPSQRDLAGKLNISLGAVNASIKRMAREGWFTVAATRRRRSRYRLTEAGAAERRRLARAYIQYACQVYGSARRRLSETFREVAADGVHRIVFFGATDLAEIAYLSLRETSIRLEAVVDREWAGEAFLMYTVQDPVRLRDLSFDKIFVTTNASDFSPGAIPLDVYSPDVVVIPS